jgi:hypothetical protein
MLKAYSVVSSSDPVFLPRLTNLHIPKLWTNNNNESYNRNIKVNNNWKVLKLPVLIDRLSDMISRTGKFICFNNNVYNLYNNSVLAKIYGMAYIFTLLMFRKPNKTTINKNIFFIDLLKKNISNLVKKAI